MQGRLLCGVTSLIVDLKNSLASSSVWILFPAVRLSHLFELKVDLGFICHLLPLPHLSVKSLSFLLLMHLVEKVSLVGLLAHLSLIELLFCDVFEQIRRLHVLNLLPFGRVRGLGIHESVHLRDTFLLGLLQAQRLKRRLLLRLHIEGLNPTVMQ